MVSARQLFWVLPLIHGPGILAKADNATYPANVEFDVVFPRNSSYAPSELIPIVFAIQNPQAADSLAFSVQWTLTQVGVGQVDGSYIDLTSTNYSSDPYYVVASTYFPNVTEGEYRLLWGLEAGNCSQGVLEPTYFSLDNTVTFTFKNGSQQPDLVASTASDTCAGIPSRTFNVTGTLALPASVALDQARSSCAVLGQPTPSPDPCVLNMDSAQASSISAAITASACAGTHPVLTTGCAQATQSASVGSPSRTGESWISGYVAIGLLGLLGLGYVC
ncbi:hypothetical protein BX600DRAFT_504378 [Xylariales sp. PMI_506]|nr:hypothetical protein BX600DRAFT_504378 [Xylariales sp. PMI_506]